VAARSSEHAQSPRGRCQRRDSEPSVTNSGHPVTFEDNADRRAGRTRTSAGRWRSTHVTCSTTTAGHGPLATPVDGPSGLVRHQTSLHVTDDAWTQSWRGQAVYDWPQLPRSTMKFTRGGPRRYTFGLNTSRQNIVDGGLPNTHCTTRSNAESRSRMTVDRDSSTRLHAEQFESVNSIYSQFQFFRRIQSKAILFSSLVFLTVVESFPTNSTSTNVKHGTFQQRL